MAREVRSERWRGVISWAGVPVASVLFAGIALCEGFLAQQPPHYLRLVWLVPTAALWASLVAVAVAAACLGNLPRFVKPTFVVTAILSPFFAWPFTQLTAPLADYADEKAYERRRAAVAETNRQHFSELTELFARPQRVVALESDALLLESGVAVELYLAKPGLDGVFQSFLRREIVGRTVEVCLPDGFLKRYQSNIRTGIHTSLPPDPRITRPYSNVPVVLFADGQLINLRFALNDWARRELLRCERICRDVPSQPASAGFGTVTDAQSAGGEEEVGR